MSDKSFQIVVTGELVDGTYLPEVKTKLAALFNTPVDKLDPLFSGKRVVIKKGLGEEAAQKYVAAVQTAGLRCVAETIGAAAMSPAPPPPAAGSPAGPSLAPVGVTLDESSPAAAPDIDTSAYHMAPVGVTMDESTPPTAPDIDTSQIDMAPVGATLDESAPPAAPDINTSAFEVAPVGATMDDSPPPAAPAIDISDLDVAPVGSDMGQAPREEAPPPPDTSHLKLD